MPNASPPNYYIALLFIIFMFLRFGLIVGGLFSSFSRSNAVICSISTNVLLFDTTCAFFLVCGLDFELAPSWLDN